MAKTRWEKKVKSKYKVLNRQKNMKHIYTCEVSWGWADIGKMCGCKMCTKNNPFTKAQKHQDRQREKKIIDEYWKEEV